MKKITRGIDKHFADAFKDCELWHLYENHKDELFIGVRNNYLNLYYNCDSIAKIEYKNNRIRCEIDKYYLNSNDKEKRLKREPKEICDCYEEIKKQSDDKATDEKKSQSKLVLLNNMNPESNWFCMDIEYVKAFHNKAEKNESDFNGRFDIIAISKTQPHRVALIELKYGSGAIGGKSGIYKHIEDFSKFCRKKFFENHLSNEIIEIITSQKKLGISLPFELPKSKNELASSPKFYMITLNNNAENTGGSTPKQTMAGYLFKDKRWDCKKLSTKYCVEEKFGDVTAKENELHVTFLFSTSTLGNIEIKDIINDDRYERI
jgi:hypothetical protein